MDDNYTRENRIKRMSLEIKLNTFYLTSMGVIIAIGVALKNEESDVFIKGISLLCLLGIGIFIANDYRNKRTEIKEIYDG